MKTTFLIFLIIPSLVFSQVSSWRNTSPSKPQVESPKQPQRNEQSNWRNSSPKEFNAPPPTKKTPNVIVYNDPWMYGSGLGWNRWGMWGAPSFGWNYWSPMWYQNDWGYRQPGRVYVYGDGRRDTIKGKKPIISFGLHKTTDRQIGGFFTVGNKGYFIMDYTSTYEVDRSTFFPYGTIDRIDFPLISDLVKKRSFYLGAGKRISRFGIHGLVGFGNERVLWRGRDSVGEITFPKTNTNFTSVKIGVLRDFKNFTLKFDYEPIREYSQFGLGLNF